MKTWLKYINKDNDVCHLLCDAEESYVFNTNKLTVFKPRFADAIHGSLLFINEDIEYILSVNREFDLIYENKEVFKFDYPKFYEKLKEWYEQ